MSRIREGISRPTDGISDLLDVQTTEPVLFFDGFETGDRSQWSATLP
ncbi:MAG: hypothetical protein AAGM22_31435 [Acidobacteriota bacterium]